jgi:hypothetical protein
MPSFPELLSEEVMRTLDAGRTAAGGHPPGVLPSGGTPVANFRQGRAGPDPAGRRTESVVPRSAAPLAGDVESVGQLAGHAGFARRSSEPSDRFEHSVVGAGLCVFRRRRRLCDRVCGAWRNLRETRRFVARLAVISCCLGARFSRATSWCPRKANVKARPTRISSAITGMIVAGARWKINPDEFWRTSAARVHREPTITFTESISFFVSYPL